MPFAGLGATALMPFADIGKTPISESNPAGDDIRLEPAFEALSEEIEKMSAPSGAGGVDWKKIVSVSSDIAAHKSKDILVVCYLCVGLLRTEGLSGLASGVAILRDLLETFWENLFPSKKRMKARRNAVDWWMEKVRSGIAGMGTEKWHKEKRDEFIEDLKAIDSFLGEHMEDAPVMSPLITNLAAVIVSEETEEMGSPVQASSAAGGAGSHESSSAGESGKTRELFPEMDTDKLLRQGLEVLGRVAAVFARQDTPNPLYFRLNRATAWISVSSLPPADEGRTLITPPDGQVVDALRNLHRSGNWKELLRSSESRVPEFLFWIDLSRYSAESLRNMGFGDMAETVAMETASYVGRLPGIERLAFSDGTPFADGETREWLKGMGRRSQPQQGGAAGNGKDEVNASIAKEISRSLERMQANQLPEALKAFRERVNSASSARERFLWEIGFCRFLAQTRWTGISEPYHFQLLGSIDTYKVEQWEPSLAIEALATVLSGLRFQKKEKDEGLEKRILDRIAILDPARALELI